MTDYVQTNFRSKIQENDYHETNCFNHSNHFVIFIKKL